MKLSLRMKRLMLNHIKFGIVGVAAFFWSAFILDAQQVRLALKTLDESGDSSLKIIHLADNEEKEYVISKGEKPLFFRTENVF